MKIRKSVKHSQQLMIFSIFILVISLFLSARYIQAFTEVENDLKAILISVEDVLSLEHELILDKELSTITESGIYFVILNNNIGNLKNHLEHFDIEDENLTALTDHVEKLANHFKALADLQIAMGLNENEGLRIQFRQSAHNLENLITNLELDKLRILLLEIRRREKDFLLRGDDLFLDKHKQHLVSLHDEIHKTVLDEKIRNDAINLLNIYQKVVYQLVDNIKKQGFTKAKGIRHKLTVEELEIYQHTTKLTKIISQTIEERITIVLLSVALFVGLLMIVSAIWLMNVNKHIYKGLITLSGTMKKITKNSDFSLRFEGFEEDEFAKLSKELNGLLSHFEQVLSRLSDANERMIESEKMASLVGMVSGVAHELNTPLGVAMTCESVIKEKITDLRKGFDKGELKKSELEHIITEAEQSIVLMESNLNKTEKLINQFKEITSYQNYDELVDYNLNSTVKGVVIMLNHEFKKIKCNVDIKIDKNLAFVGYAGAITQLLQILLLNCVRHAYVESRSLNIVIAAKKQSDGLVLTIQDDGAGIEADNLEKVFEPFFTTKRNKGGTGLGLSVVYNLVTQKFNGVIYVDSKGQDLGMLVTMELPNIKKN